MIESLTLINFQPHIKRTIHFAPAITTIIGPNDSGKTSLLRALRWVCFNRPSGTGFIRRGQKLAKAILRVDAHKVVRARSKAVNTYSLDGERLHAFGTGTPDQVSRLLNVSEVNFQNQHDPLFCLSLPPPQIARELNAIVNLDLIDQVLNRLNREHGKARVGLDLTRERLKKAEDKARELNWAEELGAKLRALEARREALEGHRRSRDALSAALSRLRALRPLLALELPTERLGALNTRRAELKTKRGEADRLRKALARLEELRGEICVLEEERVGKTQELSRMTAGRCPLCGQETGA